jgi:hypothetical protein
LDRSLLTQQAASVLCEMNPSPMQSPRIIFGYNYITAFRSNDVITAIVSTVKPRGASFGSLDNDVVLAGGQGLLRARYHHLKDLELTKHTILSH